MGLPGVAIVRPHPHHGTPMRKAENSVSFSHSSRTRVLPFAAPSVLLASAGMVAGLSRAIEPAGAVVMLAPPFLPTPVSHPVS